MGEIDGIIVCETVSAGTKRTNVFNQPTSKQAKTVDPHMASQMGLLMAAQNVEFHIRRNPK